MQKDQPPDIKPDLREDLEGDLKGYEDKWGIEGGRLTPVPDNKH